MVQRRLNVGENEVIIVGTAHVSEKSREEVRETIAAVAPDIVGVELDEAR